MSNITAEIFVPCDVLTVKVLVGPHRALSVLEELFLTALLQGLSSFEQLSDLFCIGRRPTLDLVFDLWQKDYVVLDMKQGAVKPSGKISLEKLKGLRGAEETEEVRRVMLDLLTGQVMPIGGMTGLPPGAQRMVVPTEGFEIGLRDVRTPALLAALRQVIAREQRIGGDGQEEDQAGRRKKVLGVRLSLPQLSNTSERRWLPLHVECRRDNGSEGLQIAVMESEMEASARAVAARRLGEIIEEQPDSDFATYLEESAGESPLSVPSIGLLLDRLDTLTEILDESNTGVQEQRQEELVKIAELIEEIRDEQRNAQVELEIVTSQSAQIERVFSLVRHATRQIVIASTWIHFNEIRPLVRVLRERLDRGVQCFILWGFKPGDRLSQASKNALLPLRAQYPALFFLAEGSCREHAKLVIQDDRRALISSMNSLKPSKAGTFEVGVVLSALEDCACSPIEGALEWAREKYPNFVAAQGLYTCFEDFHRVDAEDFDVELGISKPSLGAISIPGGRREEGELRRVATRLWQLAWQDYASNVRAQKFQLGKTARLLRDGEHRDVLWQALRLAKRRLLITSDRLGPEVVNDKFVGQVRERLDDGAFVSLIQRRDTQHGDPSLDGVKRELAELEGHPRFRWLKDADNHAKVVVFDDTTVISSFNFLSFYGYYVEGRNSVRRRQRSEVGVLIRSAEFADRVLECVEAKFAGVCRHWPPSPAEPPREPPPPSARAQMVDEYSEVLSAVAAASDETAQARVLRERISAIEDSWDFMKRVKAAGLPPRLLRVAAAAALSSDWPMAGLTGRQEQWLDWLAEDSWEGGRFVEAAILTSAGFGKSSDRLPRRRMVLLAAAQATGQASAVAVELLGERGLTPAERFVLAGVSLTDVALRGTLDSLQVLEQLRGELPQGWRSVVGSFKRYWEEAWQQLPMRSIYADMEAEAFRRQVDEAFNRLQESWRKAAGTHFKFISGTKTHNWLFAEGRPFGELEALIREKDAEGVHEWLRRPRAEVPGVEHLSELIDYATEQVDPGRQITDDKRVSYEATLTEVVEEARVIARLSGAAEDSQNPRMLKLASAFAKSLSHAWGTLEEETCSLNGPEKSILSESLNELRVVAQWGSR